MFHMVFLCLPEFSFEINKNDPFIIRIEVFLLRIEVVANQWAVRY